MWQHSLGFCLDTRWLVRRDYSRNHSTQVLVQSFSAASASEIAAFNVFRNVTLTFVLPGNPEIEMFLGLLIGITLLPHRTTCKSNRSLNPSFHILTNLHLQYVKNVSSAPPTCKYSTFSTVAFSHHALNPFPESPSCSS